MPKAAIAGRQLTTPNSAATWNFYSVDGRAWFHLPDNQGQRCGITRNGSQSRANSLIRTGRAAQATTSHRRIIVKRKLFQVKGLCPGDTVSQSGVYRVSHHEHRADHLVIALQGDVLPACRVCQRGVRFHLEQEVGHVTSDWDLAGPLLQSKANFG